jgi:hypothetical protein
LTRCDACNSFVRVGHRAEIVLARPTVRTQAQARNDVGRSSRTASRVIRGWTLAGFVTLGFACVRGESERAADTANSATTNLDSEVRAVAHANPPRRRESLDSAMAALPTRTFRRRSDAEIARAWHFATRDASSAMLARKDVDWIDGVITEVRRRRIKPRFGDTDDR